MGSTGQDLAFGQSYEIMSSQNNRTPSPSSSSSSESGDGNTMMDPFYSSLINGQQQHMDLQADLEMDLFPDPGIIDTFEDLQKEEQRLREELMFNPSEMNIDQFLREELSDSDCSSHLSNLCPFDVEYHSESVPTAQHQASVFLINENSSNSNTSSSSVDGDLTGVGNNPTAYQHQDQFSMSPSIDSPPLTPPELKLDTAAILAQHPLLITTTTATSDVIAVTGVDLPKLLPSLKSNKRGRSASNDDTPDVQALKRHIRMIRNRESASLSRRKKKEYLTGLETRVKELEKENEALKRENQILHTKLQQSGIKIGPLHPLDKKKGQVSVVAKVALLGLFGFFMVNLHVPSRYHPAVELSNVSEFPRTFGKLPIHGGEEDIIPLVEHYRRQLRKDSNSSVAWNTTLLGERDVASPRDSNSSQSASRNITFPKPTSYLNGTSFNQTEYQVFLAEQERGLKSTHRSSRWRSRGGRSKKSNGSGGLKSAAWVFPPFAWSPSAGNSSEELRRCTNYFNKTESMRVKSDLEDIFGKKKFGQKRKGPKYPIPRTEPIVYSLLGHNNVDLTSKKDSDSLDLNRGLTIYDGERKKFSTILEKLERREDTFYVVSLDLDNHLLLSAKASNESSRPKMTLLLPWRNETQKEDTILQIDCEVFQVFNLNGQKEKRRS